MSNNHHPQPLPTEGRAHKRLKNYIAQHPEAVGLGESLAPGKTEYKLPSGDIPDVLFRGAQCCIAVEVKSDNSNEDDLKRGIFQCVKYREILRARRDLEGGTYEVDAILALEGSLSSTELISAKDQLGVKVVENIGRYYSMEKQMEAYIVMLHLVSQKAAQFTDFRDLLSWDEFDGDEALQILKHINQRLLALSKEWDEEIPRINAFVFKEKGTCPAWVGQYIFGTEKGKQPTPRQIADYANRIHSYEKWDKVLDVFRREAFGETT